MDSDDTIDEANGRKLRELLDHPPDFAMAYIMQVHCPPGPEADAYATATVVDHVKLFRNRPDIRFTGRIHEQVLPSIRRLGGDAQLAVQWTDIHVVHSGSDNSAAGQARKLARDLRLLEMELADDPDSTFALFNLGMTLLHSGKPNEALNALCRSLQLAVPGESHLRKIYGLLVATYLQLGRLPTALKTCLQGLAVCPGDPELLFRKGSLEQSLGRLAESEQTFLALVNLKSGRHFSSLDQGILGIKAWHQLAMIYQQQARHDPAKEAWRRVLGFDHSNRAAWRGLLNSLSAAADKAGLEELSDGGEVNVPDDIRIIARARVLADGGDLQAAVAELEQAVLGEKDSLDCLDELCRLTFTNDMLDAAERWLSELVRRSPNDPSAWLNLGTVQYRKGKRSSAAASARRSLELRPNYRMSLELLELAQTLGRG
jgi:tetratricopeptide (TPR) repeat protein